MLAAWSCIGLFVVVGLYGLVWYLVLNRWMNEILEKIKRELE